MNIRTSPKAQTTLNNIAKFIEGRNTKGSDKRYTQKFLLDLKKYAQSNIEYKKCLDERLAVLKYSCINLDNWVIAFKIENKNFNIYEIIWEPILK